MYREFSDRFAKLEQLNEILAASVTKPNHAPTDTSASKPKHVPTAASARKPKQLTKLKRATVSPTSGGRGKKSRSEQQLPTPISTLSESEDSLMEESDFSDDSSEKHVTQKDVTPAAISGLPGSAEIGDAPSNPPLLPPCEQLRHNKAQLKRMLTFKKHKAACIEELQAMPDHHPEDPFYARAATELQDIEEAIQLAYKINNPHKCESGGCETPSPICLDRLVCPLADGTGFLSYANGAHINSTLT
ncbi:hypothetical protein TNCT_301561 [Trichonephila clavata]|uniref:Uncharacterized protein n=1 Tax=Trichonephila clavata TaxID=2740835 RepID=A0A8X6J569_TRICU|nr:hypothetical protein TNCT_301561 [Trichonephila clavata]